MSGPRPEPTAHRIATPDGDVAWFEWGTPGAGSSLLLIHATGFHARLWDAVVEALPADWHVIVPDLPGHGRSYKPASLSHWDHVADALLPLVDRFAGQPMLGAGHSMGGYCLTRLAAARQDAFSRLLLIDPVILPPGTYDPNAAIGSPEDHPVSRRRDEWESAQAMIDRFAGRVPYSGWVPRVLDDYCQWGLLADDGGTGFHLACPPVLEASAYLGSMHNDPAPLIAAVTRPVTVLRAPQHERAGPLDFSTSPTWPALASAFADGRDLQWNDVTHFIPMEAPERVAALIEAEAVAAKQG